MPFASPAPTLCDLELVVFDMAGTTVHDDGFVNRAFRDALGAAGLPITPALADDVMGLSRDVAIRKLLAILGQSDSERSEAIHTDFVARMNRFYATSPDVREVAGIGALFRRLQNQGVFVAVTTGFGRSTAGVILDRLGWVRDGLVDVVVTSDEVEHGRPHPDMIIRAMYETGVHDPTRVAKLGDTPADLVAGEAAGCALVIGVTYGTHDAGRLAAFPHTHLVDDPADLGRLLLDHQPA